MLSNVSFKTKAIGGRNKAIFLAMSFANGSASTVKSSTVKINRPFLNRDESVANIVVYLKFTYRVPGLRELDTVIKCHMQV